MRWFQLSRTHNAGVLGTATPGVLRAFPHLSTPEVPSLRRRYPASPVVRTSPPPCPARPAPYGVPVGACTPPPGLPVLLRLPSPIHADTTTPAGPARWVHDIVLISRISGGWKWVSFARVDLRWQCGCRWGRASGSEFPSRSGAVGSTWMERRLSAGKHAVCGHAAALTGDSVRQAQKSS